MRRTFDDALGFGEKGQDLVSAALRADGWLVMPIHQIPPHDGHGPRLEGAGEGITLPDFRATKLGYSLALDVKTKAEPTMGRLTEVPEHGIDRPCWEAMREYERRTEEAVFLVVVEWSSGEILAARISHLRPRLSVMRGVPMAYFPRSQLRTDWLETLNRHIVAKDRPRARRAADDQGSLFS